MSTGYTRQSAADIAPGLPIQSADHNNEYNQIQSAFDNTLGHDHSASTSGVGAKIDLTTSVTGILPIVNGGSGATASFIAGSIIFSNGTAFAQDNANLFWDDATNRLGIGTAAPTTALQVAGIITGVTINATTGFQVAGVPLTASNLSNGVTGTGSIVLSSTPTISTPTLTSATLNNAIAININNGTAGITGRAPLSVSNDAAHNQTFTTGKTGGTTLSWGYSNTTFSGVYLYGLDIAVAPDSGFSPTLLVVDPVNRRIAIGQAPPMATLDIAGTLLTSTSITSSGTLNSRGLLTVNLNNSSLTAQSGSGLQTTALIGAADTMSSRVVNESFGNNSTYALIRANGTAAAPSNLNTNDFMGTISWAGYGTTSANLVAGNAGARIVAVAAENFTDSAQGTFIQFDTCAIGSTTLTSKLRIGSNGAIQFVPVLVSALPTALTGGRMVVTDATATTFNSIVAGGGGNVVPVFSDGTNWRIG